MPQKYVNVEEVATFLHHRGTTTLPGHPPLLGHGQVVLCLHDAGGNSGSFAELLDALAQDHTPVAFDQPAHGRSGGLDSLGAIPAMAAHARAVATKLQLPPAVLLGAGLGAAVALEVAATDPPFPKALVLMSGAGATFDLSDEAVQSVRLIATGKARRVFDNSGYAPDTPRAVFGRAFGEWVKTDPRATLGDCIAQQAWSVADRLDQVTCPVLVVVGEHEDADAKTRAATFAESLPNGRVAELAGAGRHGFLEQPIALAQLVSTFLAEVAS